LINHFGIDGNGAGLRITMERNSAGSRTGDLLAAKPVKYAPGEPRGAIVSCYDCLTKANRCTEHGSPERSVNSVLRYTPDTSDDSPSCGVVVNDKTTAEKSPDPSQSGTGMASGTAPSCLGCDLDAHRCSGCAGPVKHGEAACRACAPDGTDAPEAAPAVQTPRPDATSIPEVPRETSKIHCQPVAGGIALTWTSRGELTPGDRAAVERVRARTWRRASRRPVRTARRSRRRPRRTSSGPTIERAAAAALKAAGIEVKVIERQMTLSELTSHLHDTHGVELPARGPLIGVEYRAVLADLHFDAHCKEQTAGEKWQARGRTPHVHPVMDRPMDNPVPRSWAKR
jgi:hypothetical protein